MPLKALDKDDGWNRGGPQTFLSEGQNQCRRGPGSLGETADGTRIENEQALTRFASRPLGDPLCKRLRPGPLLGTRLANFGH